jgi:hypothetical protein
MKFTSQVFEKCPDEATLTTEAHSSKLYAWRAARLATSAIDVALPDSPAGAESSLTQSLFRHIVTVEARTYRTNGRS